MVLVADFGKLQQEDPTLSSSFASVKTPDEAREAIKEVGVCFVMHNGKVHTRNSWPKCYILGTAFRGQDI